MKEDRVTSTLDAAAEFERQRARDEDHEYFDRDHPEPEPETCSECGEELDANGHCGYCEGDND